MTYLFKLAKRIAGLAALTGAAVAAAGCNASDTTATPPSGQAAAFVSLSVSPDNITINAGDSLRVFAWGHTASGDSVAAAVTWAASGGSISPSGWFVADSSGLYRVLAISESQQGLQDAVAVDVRAPATPTLTMLVTNPIGVTLQIGDSRQFVVTALWSDGSAALPPLAWTATGGTITATGLFVAGSQPGIYQVIASSAFGTADTSVVTIVPSIVGVRVSPDSFTLLPGATQPLQLIATRSDGSQQVMNGQWATTGGTISAAGTFSAGLIAGSFQVVGDVSTTDGVMLTDTAHVQIVMPVATLSQLTLSPSQTTLGTGSSMQLIVAASWSDGSTTTPAIAWSTSGGTVSASGLYTAGSIPGVYTVTATQQGGSITSSTQVTVVAPRMTALAIAPKSSTLQSGQTAQFSPTATWSDGQSHLFSVSYSTTGGTITSGGIFTAGPTVGTFLIIASCTCGLADTAHALVEAPPPVLTSVKLNPSAVTLTPGAPEQFVVSALWSNGSVPVPPVTYSATGGTIAVNGLYTAGNSAGTYRVVVAQLGGGKADTAIVTIAAPALTQLVLSPRTDTLQVGGTQQFAVAGVWSDGSTTAPAANYGATGGTITIGGLYTAGQIPGAYRVIAIQVGGAKADTATVTVAVPTTTLTLTPKTAAVQAGETQQFSVTGVWSDGSPTTPTATYSATGGAITAAGVYTAGGTAGTYLVIATETGGSKADTAVVTIVAGLPGCLRTVRISTVPALTSAISQAVPGDCIIVSPGTYDLTTALTITNGGTPAAPVVLQGSGSSTIVDATGHAIYLDASFFYLRRIRLTDFGLSGLWLRGVTGVVIDSVEIDHTLHEALALKNGSNHNVIKNSLFHDTGIAVPLDGEGIYVSNSGDPGYPLDFGVTDNQILYNHFGPNVRAEGIDVKEGADRTLIRGNFFDGTGEVLGSGALIGILANSVTIDSNYMQFGAPMGVAFRKPATRLMAGNVATRNIIDLEDQFKSQRGTNIPYGFQFQAGTVDPIGAVIACNNVMLTGLLSNRPCTP